MWEGRGKGGKWLSRPQCRVRPTAPGGRGPVPVHNDAAQPSTAQQSSVAMATCVGLGFAVPLSALYSAASRPPHPGTSRSHVFVNEPVQRASHRCLPQPEHPQQVSENLGVRHPVLGRLARSETRCTCLRGGRMAAAQVRSGALPPQWTKWRNPWGNGVHVLHNGYWPNVGG